MNNIEESWWLMQIDANNKSPKPFKPLPQIVGQPFYYARPSCVAS